RTEALPARLDDALHLVEERQERPVLRCDRGAFLGEERAEGSIDARSELHEQWGNRWLRHRGEYRRWHGTTYTHRAVSRFRRLAVATTAVTFALVGVGGLVRATGSGEGCPTWPGCFPGRLLPPLRYHSLIEFSHRSITIIDVVLIAVLAVAAIRSYRRAPQIL